MCSGKTTALHEQFIKWKNFRPVFVYIPSLDTRSKLTLTTHDGQTIPAQNISDIRTLPADSVVLIDEVQFVASHVVGLLKNNLPSTTYVYMAGLSGLSPATFAPALHSLHCVTGDFLQRGWPHMQDVMALCDDVFILSAQCTVCKEAAAFTIRKGDSNKLVECGGTESYEPRCRDHLHVTISKK